MGAKQNLILIQGKPKTYNLKFKDINNNPLNIINWTIFFTIQRANANNMTIILQKIISIHTDSIHGITQIVLSTNDTQNLPTGVFVFEIVAQTDVNKNYSILSGQCFIRNR